MKMECGNEILGFIMANLQKECKSFILIYTAPIPDIDMLSNRMLFSSCICMQERIVGFIVPPSFGQRNCST
jgi:hypothetical protein